MTLEEFIKIKQQAKQGLQRQKDLKVNRGKEMKKAYWLLELDTLKGMMSDLFSIKSMISDDVYNEMQMFYDELIRNAQAQYNKLR